MRRLRDGLLVKPEDISFLGNIRGFGPTMPVFAEFRFELFDTQMTSPNLSLRNTLNIAVVHQFGWIGASGPTHTGQGQKSRCPKNIDLG